MTTAAETGKRRYRSDLRKQQSAATRATVIEAAADLFAEKGWAGTAVREVAAVAGVSLETVYAHFSNKKGLLAAVIDHAVVGDEEPVPLAERPEFRAMADGTHDERLSACAAMLTDVQRRTASVLKVLREAAASDPDMAALLVAANDRRREDVATSTRLVAGRTPARDECDGIWALTSPEVYLLLVEGSGWTPGQYQEWIKQILEQTVPLA